MDITLFRLLPGPGEETADDTTFSSIRGRISNGRVAPCWWMRVTLAAKTLLLKKNGIEAKTKDVSDPKKKIGRDNIHCS